MGDIRGEVAACHKVTERLHDLLTETRASFPELSHEIRTRFEAVMQAAIATTPPGRYTYEIEHDGRGARGMIGHLLPVAVMGALAEAGPCLGTRLGQLDVDHRRATPWRQLCGRLFLECGAGGVGGAGRAFGHQLPLEPIQLAHRDDRGLCPDPRPPPANPARQRRRRTAARWRRAGLRLPLRGRQPDDGVLHHDADAHRPAGPRGRRSGTVRPRHHRRCAPEFD
ncbi:hypothetical protein GI374_15000 [Paracoccus sp. S-4012]|nr:hypothetical protein [Paracoccus sp. S-4012]